MFKFPIEINRPEISAPPRLSIHHLGLSEHPFVKAVEAALDTKLLVTKPNVYGLSPVAEWSLYGHAVDLIVARRWRQLLETAAFTTPNDVAAAVTYGLDYGSTKRGCYLTVNEARAILAEFGGTEPVEREQILCGTVKPPRACTDLKHVVDYPVETQSRSLLPNVFDEPWSRVFGIERGWYAHDRAGFLRWTDVGRAQYEKHRVTNTNSV